MEFNYKQFKYKAFQFLSIVEMLYSNTRLMNLIFLTWIFTTISHIKSIFLFAFEGFGENEDGMQ